MTTRRSKRLAEHPKGDVVEGENSPVDSHSSLPPPAAKRVKRNEASVKDATQKRKKTSKKGQLKDDCKYAADSESSDNDSSPTDYHRQEVNSQVFGNLDICTMLFSFLKTRELYSLVMSHPEYMKRLQYKHVIRSAMLTGGYPKIGVENLVALIRKRSIFVPSPLRMLRLMNGKRCEKCNTNRTNSVSQNYGVFYCSKACGHFRNHECPKGAVSNKGMNRKWGALLRHPRITTGRSAFGRLVWIDHTTTPGGEHYGPIITIQHLNDIVEKQKIKNDDERINKMNEILRLVDSEKNPDGEKDAQTIVNAYDDCVQDAKRRVQEIEAFKKATNDTTNMVREEKTREWVSMLSAEIGDVPWKDALTTFEFIKKHGSTKSIAAFACPLVQSMVKDLAAAPSKATKKKLQEVAREISMPFNKHYAHDLIEFLDVEDPFQNLLKSRLELDKAEGRLPTNLFMLFSDGAIEMMDAEQWVDAWDALVPETIKGVALDFTLEKMQERFPDASVNEHAQWRLQAKYRWRSRFNVWCAAHPDNEKPVARRLIEFERVVIQQIEANQRWRREREAAVVLAQQQQQQQQQQQEVD